VNSGRARSSYALPVIGLGRRLRPAVGHLALVTAFATALAVGLAGCGGDDPAPVGAASESPAESPAESPSESETSDAVEEIADEIREDVGEGTFNQKQSVCLAQYLVDELGEEAAREVGEAEDLPSLPPKQVRAARVAMNECIPGDALAPVLATQFYQGLGTGGRPATGVVRCISGELDGQTGDVLIATIREDARGDAPATMIAAFEACVPDGVLIDVFAQSFEDEGAGPDAARCIATKLVDAVNLTQIVELGLSGKKPGPEFQAVIEDAVDTCGFG
jgi:hypothetical protein